MASKYIKKFKVPNNFENILSDFAKEILRNQPKDIIDFGIEYFKGLEANAKFDYKDKGENRPENYKRPENQEPNIINAPNKLEISQEDKNRLQRSMDKIERINKDPVPISEKEEDRNKKEEYEFSQGRHVSKYIQEGEMTRKVVTKEEVYVRKQETVIRNGEVIRNETTEHRYISGNGGEDEGNVRYGGIVEGNEEHKKEYDDWFTKHSMDKQVIDYKPEKEPLDENLKRNEVGYKTWFNNHSVRSIDQSQSGGEERAEGDQEHKFQYDDWFNRHSRDKMVIEYKRPAKKLDENVTRCEVDYPTWFKNHSKLTNKQY